MPYDREADPMKCDFALFPNDYKKEGDNKPEMVGRLEFTRSFLREVGKRMKETGEVPKIQVAAWDRTSAKSGLKFKSCVLRIDDYERKEEPKEEDPFA
jgi:hypothetical protein